MGRLMAAFILVLIGLGLLWSLTGRRGFGRLPGDILVHRAGFTFYAPLATCLLVSIVVSMILWLLQR